MVHITSASIGPIVGFVWLLRSENLAQSASGGVRGCAPGGTSGSGWSLAACAEPASQL